MAATKQPAALERGPSHTETSPLLSPMIRGRASGSSSSLSRTRNRKRGTSVVELSRNVLEAAIKTDAEIAELSKAIANKKNAPAVARFYKDQNDLIQELLKPIDEDDQEDESEKLLKVQFALYASLCANILLFGVQMFAAVTSGSLALFATMADAFMDLASSVVLVFATVSAADKNPQHYPAGKQRFETAAIVVFSCIMGSLSVELIIEGAKALMEGEHETDINATNLSCIAFAVGVKSLLYIYCYALRQYPTAMILAQDHRNDVILNVTGVVLSLVGQYSIWYADPIGGILIALWILFNWGETAFEHIQKFIGQAASRVFLNRITFIAMTHDVDIQLVDTVRAYSSGAGYFVEVDIVMDPNTPLHKAHDIAESLQNKIERLDDVERAFVHIDYEATHTPEHSY